MGVLDLITSQEEYWGEVVDVNDPVKGGRVKVKVKTIFDEIPTDCIPWATPRYVDSGSFEKPALGSVVNVKFVNNEILKPQWYRIRKSDVKIDDGDYESYTVLKQKDLSEYGLDGKIDIAYTKAEGLKIHLERGGKGSELIIRNDNTMFFKNGQSGRIIHISNESIALGSETKAQQPGVVGDDNKKALEMLNNTIKDLKNEMKSHLSKIETLADSSPYTKHLKIGFKGYGSGIESNVNSNHSKNDSFFPETLSKIVTIDKT